MKELERGLLLSSNHPVLHNRNLIMNTSLFIVEVHIACIKASPKENLYFSLKISIFSIFRDDEAHILETQL